MDIASKVGKTAQKLLYIYMVKNQTFLRRKEPERE